MLISELLADMDYNVIRSRLGNSGGGCIHGIALLQLDGETDY